MFLPPFNIQLTPGKAIRALKMAARVPIPMRVMRVLRFGYLFNNHYRLTGSILWGISDSNIHNPSRKRG